MIFFSNEVYRLNLNYKVRFHLIIIDLNPSPNIQKNSLLFHVVVLIIELVVMNLLYINTKHNTIQKMGKFMCRRKDTLVSKLLLSLVLSPP